MKRLCVYQEALGVMVRVGRVYRDLDKAVRFAGKITNPRVEVRNGNYLEAIRIKGEMKIVPTLD